MFPAPFAQLKAGQSGRRLGRLPAPRKREGSRGAGRARSPGTPGRSGWLGHAPEPDRRCRGGSFQKVRSSGIDREVHSRNQLRELPQERWVVARVQSLTLVGLPPESLLRLGPPDRTHGLDSGSPPPLLAAPVRSKVMRLDSEGDGNRLVRTALHYGGQLPRPSACQPDPPEKRPGNPNAPRLSGQARLPCGRPPQPPQFVRVHSQEDWQDYSRTRPSSGPVRSLCGRPLPPPHCVRVSSREDWQGCASLRQASDPIQFPCGRPPLLPQFVRVSSREDCQGY